MGRFLEYKDDLKQYNRNVRFRVAIDWFDAVADPDIEIDNNEDLEEYLVVIEDDIDSISVDRDIEGIEGTSIRDNATIVLNNEEGKYNPKNLDSVFTVDINEGKENVIEPVKRTYIQVKIGDNNEWINYHYGVLTDITPQRMTGDVTLEINDPLYILQTKTVPNELYINEEGTPIKTSRIVREWLSEVNAILDYDNNSIDEFLTEKIIYDFGDVSYFDALNMIMELNDAYFYTTNGAFKVKSKPLISEGNTEIIDEFSDSEKNDYHENIFNIEESLNRDNMFNEVEIKSEPLETGISEEVVWTGGEEQSEVSETYFGEDIIGTDTVEVQEYKEENFDEFYFITESTGEFSEETNKIELPDSTDSLMIKVDFLVESFLNWDIDLILHKDSEQETLESFVDTNKGILEGRYRNIDAEGVNEVWLELDINFTSDRLTNEIKTNVEDADFDGNTFVTIYYEETYEGASLNLSHDPIEEEEGTIPETFTPVIDNWYDLKFDNIIKGTEILEDKNGDEVPTENYEMEYSNGKIKITEGEEQQYLIDYSVKTRNVPIVPGSLAVEWADNFLTVEEGLLGVDRDKGIIIFEEGKEPVDGEMFEVSYDYYFNQVLPGRKRTFMANLEHPCFEISDLGENLIARSVDMEESRAVRDTVKKYFNDLGGRHGDDGWEHGAAAGLYHFETEKIEIPQNSFYAHVNINCRIYSSRLKIIIGRVSDDHAVTAKLHVGNDTYTLINASGEGNETYSGSQSFPITGDDIGKEVYLEFDADISGGRDPGFRFPRNHGDKKNKLIEFETVEDPEEHDPEEVDDVFVRYRHKDNLEKVYVEIKNKSNERVSMRSEIKGKEEELMAITGYPIRNQEVLSHNREDTIAKEKYEVKDKLTINNNLFRNKEQMKRLSDFLLYQYAKPRSELTITTPGYVHTELLDMVYIQEEYRDIDNKFLIHSINDEISDGVWEQTYNLVEFDEDWDFERDRVGFPVTPINERDTDKVLEPEPVSSVNAYISETRTSPDGTYNARLFAEWDNPNNPFHDEVEVFLQRDDKDWIMLGETSGESFETNVTPADEYKLRLRSRNRTGERTNIVESPELILDVLNKEAPQKTNFTHGEFIDEIELKWASTAEQGIEGYEIRLADSNVNSEFGVDNKYLVARTKSTGLILEDFEDLPSDEGNNRKFTFYIKPYDNIGNYSEKDDDITVENPQPEPPDNDTTSYQTFFESVEIDFVKPSDKTIHGFEIRVEKDYPEDHEKNVETYIRDLGMTEEARINAPSDTDITFEIRSYDTIGSGEWSTPISTTTKGLDNIAQFAQELQPPELVEGLPELPNPEYPEGSLVVNETDKTLYKNVNEGWTGDFDVNGLTKFQNIVAATVVAGGIGAQEIVADEIFATETIGSREIIAEESNIRDATITSAHIRNLEASKIRVGGGNNNVSFAKPERSYLAHFDGTLQMTDGTRPIIEKREE